MKINDLMHDPYQPIFLAPKIHKSEQEMKAAQEFTAIFYEKMLTSILQPKTRQGILHQDLAWQVLSKEIASEMSAAPNSLLGDFFTQKK